MNRKNSQSKSRMTLRKLSKKTFKEPSTLPQPMKQNKKLPSSKSKEIRKFGTDLTNQQNRDILQKTKMQQQESSDIIQMMTPQLFNPGQDWQPYVYDIRNHIINMDWKYHTTAIEWSRTSSNKEITPQMRSILIKWIVQVGQKFRVNPQTLHICVQVIDYVLMARGISINKMNYQLLGISSLFVASKYNEINIPDAQKYIFVCDGQYNSQQLFEMQALILTTTQFNLQIPPILQFTDHLIKDIELPENCRILVKNLSNMCVFDFNLFNKYKKIDLAAVVVYLASKIVGSDVVKSKVLMEEVGVQGEKFRECLLSLISVYQSNTNTNANSNSRSGVQEVKKVM